MKRALIISLLLNALFGAAFSVRLYRRAVQPAAARQSFRSTPAYQCQAKTFATLPRNSAGEIIFVGDSLTRLGEWSELLGRVVVNRGIGGDDVEGVTLRIEEILARKPKLIFLMVGINDLLSGGKKPSDILPAYRQLVERIRGRAQLVIQSVLPVREGEASGKLAPDIHARIRQLNTGLTQLADGNAVLFLNLHPVFALPDGSLDPRYSLDGVHLNGAGYQLWASLLNQSEPLRPPQLEPRS